MRLPGIVACNKLDLGRLNLYGDRIHPTDVVEWLEHEAPPENEWSEPRQLILNEDGIVGGIGGLLTTLKAVSLIRSRGMRDQPLYSLASAYCYEFRRSPRLASPSRTSSAFSEAGTTAW